MTIYRTGVCTYIIPTIRYMWFTNVYKIYKQHTNYLIASNMTSYSTSIQNQQTDRQGNSIHDVLGMPCSGRRLQFCSGFHMTLMTLMTRCHYICKMFPTVSVLPTWRRNTHRHPVIHPVPYLPCLRENVGGKARVVWLHSLSGVVHHKEFWR